MSFFLHGLVMRKPDGSTSAYAIFYQHFMRIQLFQNFLINIVSELELQYERKHEYDWDKNFYPALFNFPTQAIEEQAIIDIKDDIKKYVGLTKDYYLVLEEASLTEFIFIMSAYESYLRHLYLLLLRATPSLLTEKVKLTRDAQKAIILNTISNAEGLDMVSFIEDSIQEHLLEFSKSKNASSGTAEIIKLIYEPERIIFYNNIDYDEVKTTLEKFVELRNIHIHNAGIMDQKYQNMLGLYGTDKFRGMMVSLAPALDEAVKKTIEARSC